MSPAYKSEPVRRFGAALILAVAALAPCSVAAQNTANYPTKPIRLVVPQPPGGATDIEMRLYAQKVGEMFGQQIIVDNREGSGVSGTNTLVMVARANPDGYTVLGVSPSFSFAPALAKDLPIDPIKDFAPITLLLKAPYLLVAYPGLPAKSVKELIALAKAKPDMLNFGANNIGSGTHLVTMFFLTQAGIRSQATYIPYKGTGAALVDLMAGRIHSSITSAVSSGPHVKSGKLRALGITTAQRSTVLPDIPTIAEQGITGFDAYSFTGWAAPAKTPAAIINKLSAAAAKATKSPEIIERIKNDGAEVVGSTPEEFRQLIAREVPRWLKLVKELGGIAATSE